MQPIPEAVAWSLRAEAWAQNEDQAVEKSSSGTVSRWSDVEATGRPPIPADGVGWRTSTAEWRATTDSAHWRQTTEWRSASGRHGWRTTTEAWQAGDADGFVPPATEPPTRLPAISGTAWPTPDSADPQSATPPASAVPSWQQSATPSWQQPPASSSVPSWQQPAADTPSWQRAAPPESTPSWQQRPADAPPSWQRAADLTRPGDAPPSWQTRPGDATPSWQQRPADPAPGSLQRPADAGPAWQQRPADATPSWQMRPADAAPSRQQRPEDATPSWQQRPEESTPSWQQRPADAAPSWQRIEERPSWQAFAAPPTAPPAPPWETSARPAQQPADAPLPRPSWDSRPSWQQFTESRSESAPPREPSRPAADRPQDPPSWQNPQPSAYTGSWSAFDNGRHLVREDDRAQWRRESAAGQAGLDDGSRSAGRRRASDPGSRTSGGTGWTVRSDADNWAGHTDTGSIPAFQDPAADTPGWRRDAPSDSWRTSSTTNGWRSGDEAGRGSDQDRGGSRDGWRDGGSWRRDAEPADPWAQNASETGVIPLPLQPRDTEGGGWQSRADTSSWQRDPGTADSGGRRGRSDRTDTGSWQRDDPRDTGSWSREALGSPRGDDSRDTGSRQRDDFRDTGSWQRDDSRDTGSRQRDDLRDTGSWQRDDLRDTGSWQRDDPRDTGSWRQDGRGRGEGRREIESGARADTGSWQRDPETTRGRRPGRQRGPEAPHEPRRGLDAQRGPGTPRREGPAAYARRREPDTSWQRDLESGNWHRDPESDVWLRDADTGQWHRAEVDDDEDDEDDGQPRRRRRARPDDDNVPGGPLALESGETVRRRSAPDDEDPRDRDLRDRDPRDGGPRDRDPREDGPRVGRRRAPDGPLELTARAEPPLDPEVYRRDNEPPTRPVSSRPVAVPDEDPTAWLRDLAPGDDLSRQPDPGSSRPAIGSARPVSSQPGGGAPRPTSSLPAAGAARPVSSQPIRPPGPDRPTGTARPDQPYGTARPEQTYGTARSEQTYGTARPEQPTGTARSAAAAEPDSYQPGGSARPTSSLPGGGAARPTSSQPGGGAARPTSSQPGGGAARPTSAQPGAWRAEAQAAARTDAWRSKLRAEEGVAPDDATEIRPRGDQPAWQQAERDEGPRGGGATYREGRSGDWRRELVAESNLSDGESRRFGTSDFVPFRPPSKNGASASVKVPAANSASEGRTEVIERTGASWQDPPDTEWPPRGAVMASSAGTYERRPVSTFAAATARQNDLLEPDEELEEDTGGPLAAVGYTVVWYGVPVVLFVLYMLVLNGTQQAHALSTLAGAAPQFGLSLVLSMLVAVGLRWASGSWKAASVGLAAAVMGGGLATVLTSAITGQSLS
ncbi:hypothetical protein [Pseudosporangium ferrugineum]|uniref:Uncharacterized protein n=1 Tax=Pseudosporangium ferrugineum TaxID=439699 RepID=A0A2T0S1C8_9ACTN|nr:hypothetical protein [Pseudosporangium ferrugineum]PRY27226.1 hypothetical protein CLV70_111193 [Pseudosporangium ferrugineum]